VLGKFDASETELLEKVLARAVGQVDCWLNAGLQKAMSQFNGAISPTNEEK
jgi:peptidyl-tRNA hydrolase